MVLAHLKTLSTNKMPKNREISSKTGLNSSQVNSAITNLRNRGAIRTNRIENTFAIPRTDCIAKPESRGVTLQRMRGYVNDAFSVARRA